MPCRQGALGIVKELKKIGITVVRYVNLQFRKPFYYFKYVLNIKYALNSTFPYVFKGLNLLLFLTADENTPCA